MTISSKLTGGHGIVVLEPYGYVPMTGVVRWNVATHTLEAMGQSNDWHPVPIGGQVSLSPDVIQVLNWCKAKQEEEEKLTTLCAKHPALANAKAQFDTVLALVKDHDDTLTDT